MWKPMEQHMDGGGGSRGRALPPKPVGETFPVGLSSDPDPEGNGWVPANLSGHLVGAWQGGPSCIVKLVGQSVCRGRGFPNPVLTIPNFPPLRGTVVPSPCHLSHVTSFSVPNILVPRNQG